MNICVYGAASSSIQDSYIKAGERLGALMAKQGHTMVFGGGADGLMGACARGIKENGGHCIGIVPSFFNVDGALYDNCDEIIYTETMRKRKKLMEEKSDAFIVTPGGVGTMDEFFEIFTLRHLKQHSKPIYILNTNGYYDSLDAFFRHMIGEGFLNVRDQALYEIYNTPEELIEAVRED